MGLIDLFLAPLFIVIILAVARNIKQRNYKNDELGKYFMPGLALKLAGAILSGMIYFYYYGEGDTTHYWLRISKVNGIFGDDPGTAMRILFATREDFRSDLAITLYQIRAFDTASFMIVRLGIIPSLITFNTYTGTALIFAVVSFTGVWKLVVMFSELYPRMKRQIAISCLFIPSVFFWGSGLFKDSVSLGMMGWMVYCIYRLVIKREFKIKYIIMLAISGYLVYVIKPYILMSITPGLAIWIFMSFTSGSPIKVARGYVVPFAIIVSLGIGLLAMSQLGQFNERWSIEEVQDRAKDMQWWHKKVVEVYGEEQGGGSFYSIGDGSFSTTNILISFPQAVVVTLFRPFIWEARNPIMLMTALESMFLLFLTLSAIRTAGLGRFFKFGFSHPTIFFFLFFAIFFAFAVGFTSFNFGALARYKIPCLPFYAMALYIVIYETKVLKGEIIEYEDDEAPELRDPSRMIPNPDFAKKRKYAW